MARVLFAVVTLALMLGCMLPALARDGAPVVEDREQVIGRVQAAELRQRLADLKPHTVVVVFTRTAAGDIERQAIAAFERNRLDGDDVAVAIAVADRKVAAHVGQALTDRGLDRAAIVALIGSRFKEHARAGRYDVGAFALAEALATYSGGPLPEAAPETDVSAVEAPARAPERSAGFPWWQLLMVPLLGAGVFFVARKAGDRRRSDESSRAWLRDAHERIMAAVLKIDDASSLARTASGDPLNDATTLVMEQARAFGERMASPKSHDLASLEVAAVNLEVAIAALRTAYAAGATAADPVPDALRLGRRWKAVEAQVAHLVRTGKANDRDRAMLADLVEKAYEAMIEVPARPEQAEELITELEARLKDLGLTRVKSGGKRSRSKPASDWDTRPLVVTEIHHGPSIAVAAASSSSDSSWSWGSSGSTGSSWDSGSSGSSSWDSGSSGSSSWDSGSSGSSSWDSGSSSSDSGSSSGSTGSDSW